MKSPLYDLERVVMLASARRVSYGRRVQVCFQELGYSFEDVCDCLSALRAEDYSGVAEYEGVSYDVYKPKFPAPSGHIDDLYVKLSERGNATVHQVVLHSFHLQRMG